MNFCILMTACVTPNSSFVLYLKDPKERAKQYLHALSYYFYNTDYNIVFAENSGTQITIPKEIKDSDRVEILTWKEEPERIDRGKGYKEGKILEKIAADSKLFAECDIVIKITGRLIVKNICQIVDDLKQYPSNTLRRILFTYWGWRFMYMDTRFMIVSKCVFKQMQRYNNMINTNTGMEEVYATACRELIRRKEADYRLPKRLPLIEGVGGGTGEKYGKKIMFYKRMLKYYFYYWKHKDSIIDEIIDFKQPNL